MENIIVDFILKETPGGGTNIDAYDATAQTGDSLLIVLSIVLALIAALLFFFNHKKSNAHFFAYKGSKHVAYAQSYCKKVINFVSVLIATCALIMMTFAFCNSAIAQPNTVVNNAETHNTTPGHVNAYVDPYTGSVEFDKAIFSTDHDITISSYSVGLLDGIDDGACTWTIKYENEIIFNDVADGTVYPIRPAIKLSAGESIELELGSTITPEYALALAGKSVLSISCETSSLNILSWGEGIVSVEDEAGNDIVNGQQVAAGTRLFATTEEFEAYNYTFSMQELNGITEKDFATGYTADFNMPDHQINVSAKEHWMEFYAVFDDTNKLSFYYNEEGNQQPNYSTIFRQPQFNFGPGGEEKTWPYLSEYASKITQVEFDPSVSQFYGFKSTANMFRSLSKAVSILGAEYLQTENVTDMQRMFFEFGKEAAIENVPNVRNWNTSNVTSFYNMFCRYAANTKIASFDLVPDVSLWKTSKVWNMAYVFCDYAKSSTSLNSVPDVYEWDTSNVTRFKGMFSNYGQHSKALNCVPNVSKWNTSKVAEMNEMFNNYASDSEVISCVPDVSEWKTLSVTNMSEMFKNYASYFDGEHSTFNCVPDVSGWDTSNVTDFSEMFYYYAQRRNNLNVFPDFSNWDTRQATDMSYMFDGYAQYSKNISELLFDLSSFDTTKVTTCRFMLSQSWITKIKIGAYWNLSLYDSNLHYENWKINGGDKIKGLKNLDNAIKNLDKDKDFPALLTAVTNVESNDNELIANENEDDNATENEEVNAEESEEVKELEGEEEQSVVEEDVPAADEPAVVDDPSEPKEEDNPESVDECSQFNNVLLTVLNFLFF